MENQKNKKSKLKIILIIVIFVILLIAGVFAYVQISEDNCTGDTTNVNANDEENNKTNINYEKSIWEQLKENQPSIHKPIIYLYPQEKTEISVKLGKLEKITCSYPKYEDEWKVVAEPDGTLIDIKTQRELYALYWEGKDMKQPKMTDGFVIKGEDTIKFLEEKLEILGLNEREAEEFIIYWLPKMQNNKYNYIRFATIKEINEYMPLEFSVQPDSIIRVLMQYKSIDEYIEIQEQQLTTPKREGFVVVEWGGSEIK